MRYAITLEEYGTFTNWSVKVFATAKGNTILIYERYQFSDNTSAYQAGNAAMLAHRKANNLT